MYPNSSNLSRAPFPPKYQEENNFFLKVPLSIPPTPLSHQQVALHPFHIPSAVLSRALLSGNIEATPPVTPAVALQPVAYGNVSPLSSVSSVLTPFQGRKRQSQQTVPDDAKRQRIHSLDSDTAVVNQAVPLPEERRYLFPTVGSVLSPVLRVPALGGCVPPLQDTLFPNPTESSLPAASDKLSQQILELFQTWQQQASDLNRKELCRSQLQREIQLIFPQSRLFLVGSSLNGFGSRSSDGDLCLVVKEEPVNQKTEARRILSLVQKLFSTKLWIKKLPKELFQELLFCDKVLDKIKFVYQYQKASYIERPQLIRAKVPIVRFRDKVSNVDFDLNVNNLIGIRNTFLLRTYAFIENRVRPLVLVIKKWARFHEINDASRGTLSSYSLVLMALNYLQTLPEPILPSLQKNYPECFDPTMQLYLVHQAPCTIPPYISKNGSSLGDLLIGFFKYYATEFDECDQEKVDVLQLKYLETCLPAPLKEVSDFNSATVSEGSRFSLGCLLTNWSHQIISVREAKAIARPDGGEWRNKFICVEEPFDRTNTARAVHEKLKFDMIRGEFLQAWRILEDKKDLTYLLPSKGGKHKR